MRRPPLDTLLRDATGSDPRVRRARAAVTRLAAHASLYDPDLHPQLAAEAGLPLLGMGAARVVFDFGSGLVLKVPGGEDLVVGRAANRMEAAIWGFTKTPARRWLRDWLVPVVAAAPDGAWLLMERTDPRAGLAEDERPDALDDATCARIAEVVGRGCAELDLGNLNWGVHQGRLKLLDYGWARLRAVS